MAMENGPFEDVIISYLKWGYSIAMLVYQRVDRVHLQIIEIIGLLGGR